MPWRLKDSISHRQVTVNGISMHVAEKGSVGPVVIFIHGFPELWYSWHHQISDIQNWELTAPKVPVKFIVGDVDLAYNTGNTKDYIHKGGFKKDVHFLEKVVVMGGVGHFVNDEKPDEVSDHIYDFIQKY